MNILPRNRQFGDLLSKIMKLYKLFSSFWITLGNNCSYFDLRITKAFSTISSFPPSKTCLASSTFTRIFNLLPEKVIKIIFSPKNANIFKKYWQIFLYIFSFIITWWYYQRFKEFRIIFTIKWIWQYVAFHAFTNPPSPS